MTDTIFFALQFAALIFFNILCIFGIIASLVVISSMVSIKKKIEETAETAQQTLTNANSVGEMVSSFLGYFFQPKKTGIFDLLVTFFNRRR